MQLQNLRIYSHPDFRDYLIIVAGMALYAIGFTVFILPHEIVVGGMAGFSTLVYFATGGLVPVAVTMYVVNIMMLIGWFRLLGRKFVIRTVFGATLLSAIIGAIEGYFTSHAPIVADTTMSVLMGSAICGLGIGLYYAHKGSAGGTDIVAAIFEKKSNISIGRTMMIIDVAIVTCSFFLPFDGDMDARIQARVQTIIYGWASIAIYSFLRQTDYTVSDTLAQMVRNSRPCHSRIRPRRHHLRRPRILDRRIAHHAHSMVPPVRCRPHLRDCAPHRRGRIHNPVGSPQRIRQRLRPPAYETTQNHQAQTIITNKAYINHLTIQKADPCTHRELPLILNQGLLYHRYIQAPCLFPNLRYNIIGHSIEVLLMEARIEIRSVYSRIIQFFWKKPKLSESEIVYNAEEPDSSP